MIVDRGRPGEGAAEWLDLGRAGRTRFWRRPWFLPGLAILVIAALTLGAALAQPYWNSRNRQLDQAQVRAAVAALELTDLVVRLTSEAPLAGLADDPCIALQAPIGRAREGRVPSVEATGRAADGRAWVTVVVLVLESPEVAAGRFGDAGSALADESCRNTPLGRLGIDPPPLPDRQLAYGIASGGGGGGADSWWYRVRVLRFGNTVSFLTTFGPVGSADVTAPLVESLDRALAAA
ncbi:hypothetical protein [Microlunatus parietis]|uniref:Uncharacterized protein n=1 Tax=Microlunatus parietis TaxID=682979 RepID=A0A7Y9IBE5_9ACTN|nr:hypothetical protein [Microlunatus parietis]NYE73749.1 hypothetical protein [Microlunatus parietis]